MVTPDLSPDAFANDVTKADKLGGNTDQPDDGRDKKGRLPEPTDAADYTGPAYNPFADKQAMQVAGKPTGAVKDDDAKSTSKDSGDAKSSSTSKADDSAAKRSSGKTS